eukprot:354880-Chlamydomonas_euryale.AAC.2
MGVKSVRASVSLRQSGSRNSLVTSTLSSPATFLVPFCKTSLLYGASATVQSSQLCKLCVQPRPLGRPRNHDSSCERLLDIDAAVRRLPHLFEGCRALLAKRHAAKQHVVCRLALAYVLNACRFQLAAWTVDLRCIGIGSPSCLRDQVLTTEPGLRSARRQVGSMQAHHGCVSTTCRQPRLYSTHHNVENGAISGKTSLLVAFQSKMPQHVRRHVEAICRGRPRRPCPHLHRKRDPSCHAKPSRHTTLAYPASTQAVCTTIPAPITLLLLLLLLLHYFYYYYYYYPTTTTTTTTTTIPVHLSCTNGRLRTLHAQQMGVRQGWVSASSRVTTTQNPAEGGHHPNPLLE